MKVIHIAPGVYPIPSRDKAAAIEEVIFQLSNHLIELGCQVYIIDIKTKQSQRNGGLANFREAWNLPSQGTISHFLFTFKAVLFAFTSLPVLWHLLSHEKIVIIHTHYSYSAVTTAIFSKLKQGIHVVHTTHAHDLIMNPCLKNYLKGIPEIIVLKIADHIIAETPAVKRRLLSEFRINPAKISVIYSGPEQEKIKQFASTKGKNSSNSEKIILCVGRISKRKNQLAVVESIPEVLARHSDVKFIFAGPVNESDYLRLIQKFINERDISRWVKFTGEISKQKLFELYNSATIFVFLTLAEMQGLVLMEAMAFGLPVIASKIEPIVDISNLKPDSIITVNPNDPNEIAEAIILLLEDPSLRQLMSVKAKEVASSFSWEHTAKKTLRLYESLIENGGPKIINRREH